MLFGPPVINDNADVAVVVENELSSVDDAEDEVIGTLVHEVSSNIGKPLLGVNVSSS